MSDIFSVPQIGPGSQPGDEDGGALEYMQMPSGMITFAAPDLPEPEDIENIDGALAALEKTLTLLNGYESDGAHNIVELGGLDANNLAFVNQALGEGEVSAIGDNAAQAQESVLAGVWRVRLTDPDGAVIRDVIEVASFPTLLRAMAFEGAKARVDIPETFGEDVFNAPPLLPEINEHAPRIGPGSPSHVINLSLLPHTEADLGFLNERLGVGRLIILSRGYGNCRVDATATRNVWWVRFFNSQDTLILNSIEIADIPDVALAAPEDIADSAERLDEILEIYR